MKEKELRKDAIEVLNSALDAINPKILIRNNVKLENNTIKICDCRINLNEVGKIFVVGGGKASGVMASELENILGDLIETGSVNVKYGHSAKTKKIIIKEAGHPYPDDNGIKGVKEIFEILKNVEENDLVISLISGGGSALLPYPVDEISLSDKQGTTKLLLNAGADIRELNCIRKHISKIKGGQLSAGAYPSEIISLILSDVIDDKLDVIASGPTYPDSTTFDDALNVLKKYDLVDKIPHNVLDYIQKGKTGHYRETLKEGDKVFKKTHNFIIGNNSLAINAAKNCAARLGYRSIILTSSLEGEAKEVGKFLGSIAKEIKKSKNPLPGKCCIIIGGETTVTVKGNGLGGRNQELILASIAFIDGLEDVVLLSCGTDGTDGPTDAAGAIADGLSKKKALDLNLDTMSYLNSNDSYHFFEKMGNLIKTGPTFSNVMDIMLLLAE